MRLFISAASPFVRKCRIVIREQGLTGWVEELVLDFPYKTDPAHLAANPIGQVPALVTEEGGAFIDSPLICEYLDGLGQGDRLVPREGPERWRALRLQALSDGIMEMAVKMTMESRRPDGERSETWIEHWRAGMMRGLDAVEAEAPGPGSLDIGGISAAVAATYVEFRRPDAEWRKGRPRLAELRDGLEARQSFRDTFPR
jgi:glutathione S-transferase